MSEFKRLRDLTTISAATMVLAAGTSAWSHHETAQEKIDCYGTAAGEIAVKDCVKEVDNSPASELGILAFGGLIATIGFGSRAYNAHKRESLSEASQRQEQSQSV